MPDLPSESDRQFAARRADKAFMDRLATRMREDAALLERLAEGDTAPTDVLISLLLLPLGMYAGANRYDTDDECVLSLWREDGTTHDLRWPVDRGGSLQSHRVTNSTPKEG